MNWSCDLYCYESTDGWITHVAGNRVLGDIPKEPSWDLLDPASPDFDLAKWIEQHNAIMEFLDKAERVDIDLPYAGEHFIDDDLPSFKSRLMMLRSVGYRFPDYVLEQVDEEMNEASV